MKFKFVKKQLSSIDPSIQKHLLCKDAGQPIKQFVSSPPNRIPVIARVKNCEAWKNHPKVQPGIVIPDPEIVGTYFVTGRVLVEDLVTLRQDTDLIITLKAARSLTPSLHQTNANLGIKPDSEVPSELLEQAGEGVMIGVVDFGIDFMQPGFRHPNGETRINAIWDQSWINHPPERPQAAYYSPKGYDYGREILADEINDTIKTASELMKGGRDPDTPYSLLNYIPKQKSHGTHVTDIAGGCDPANPGIAPKAELVFVELNTKVPETIEEVLAHDFGDSVRLVEAVHYIFQKAAERKMPCVVNLSLGTNGGPHDGSNPVEQALDAMVRSDNNRAVVIAASNSQVDNIHYEGELKEKGVADLSWVIPKYDKTYNELEIWYSKEDKFRLELTHDGGSVSVELGESGLVTAEDDEKKLLAYIVHREEDPNNGDNVIHIFQDPLQIEPDDKWGGVWQIKLHGEKVVNGKFHAWVERDHYLHQSTLDRTTPTGTLGSISSGKYSIVVGSYDAHVEGIPISSFSSSGPTRDGRYKPEVSAPGHDVLAASSRPVSQEDTDKYVRKSGTSMAAPAVTGLIARVFGLAKKQDRDLTIGETRNLVFRSVSSIPEGEKEWALNAPPKHNPENLGMLWHSRYGYGGVNARVLLSAQKLSPSHPDPALAKSAAPKPGAKVPA